jgi:AcrR family transcriptional regulator
MSTKRSSVAPGNRRRAASREALLDAAARVFSRNGFHRATLDAIADEAGLTKGAVYSSFDGKDDLFFALQRRRFTELREQVAATARQAADGRSVGAAAASQLPFDPEWNLLFLEFVTYAARHPEFRGELVAHLQEQRRRNAVEVERLAASAGGGLLLSAERVARLAGAMANGLAIEALLEPDADAQELLADALEVFWRGVHESTGDLGASSD